ncbi:unnamed protein product [Heligmosomoides polygyrus]|uniref:Reverse transcriptase domain-containing protein n=1 Tax=Heligmosomoides polygyrus TaxID=6339 RepID=A0A183GM34_HELPZ|nr:unnamed protein product [Heligmosomoides polygyrus]
MKDLNWDDKGYLVDGKWIRNLRFTDDIVLISTSTAEVGEMLNEFNVAFMKTGLNMNMSKTQFTGLDRDGQAHAAGQPNQDDIDVVAAALQIPAEPNAVAAVPGGGSDVLKIIYKIFSLFFHRAISCLHRHRPFHFLHSIEEKSTEGCPRRRSC